MYDELYKTWKAEIESKELEKLPAEFYCKTAEYMKKLREEGRMLDKRTLKTSLLRKELQNAKHMVHQLIQTRYRKVISKTARGEGLSQEMLTPEERTIYSKTMPLPESVHTFAQEIVRGQTPKIKIETENRRVALRFLKDVPAIVGADMKTYGPFKIEDIGVLPAENTRILIKQGLAEKVETE